jgi:hypothetical protein
MWPPILLYPLLTDLLVLLIFDGMVCEVAALML